MSMPDTAEEAADDDAAGVVVLPVAVAAEQTMCTPLEHTPLLAGLHGVTPVCWFGCDAVNTVQLASLKVV
jgi:hypothetical protein